MLYNVKKENLGNQVFEQLKEMIFNGEFPLGERIIESEVADSIGISRTPVREALHKLEAEKLLVHLPKGGYVVKGMSLSEIKETFDIRVILESFAGFLAAKRCNDKEILPLEKKLEEFEEYLVKNDLKELTRINTEFHELLYALSKSPKLIKMINGLRDDIFLFREILLDSMKMAGLSHDDHKEMIKAIKNREAKKVERLIKEHILRGEDFVIKEMKKTG
ncbi:MAG: GntR family transcriptional regulator [Thermodesulfobacteriota bacterium]|nr:GntR family transcriptional regulator [Thermodesulfobacteriota bacterium]